MPTSLFQHLTHPFKRNIQLKLTCYFLCVLIPLVGISLVANVFAQNILKQQVTERTQVAMIAAMEQIDLTLQSIHQLTNMLASNRNLLQILRTSTSAPTTEDIFNFSQIVREITDMTALNYAFSGISIIHAPSEMVLSTQFGGTRMPGIMESSWAVDTMRAYGASTFYIPEVVPEDRLLQLFNEDSIAYIRTMDPIRSRESSHLIVANINRHQLLAASEALLPSKSAQVQLLTGDNRQIASSKVVLPDPKQDLLTIEVSSSYSDWRLIMTQPESEIYAAIKPIRTLSYVIIGISIMLALWISWIVFSSIASPLERLSNGMKQVQIGNLDIQIPHQRQDEFGYLMNAFNLMALEQKNLIKNFYEQRLQLSQTELKFLQSQMNPHFLYNTLDSIYWMAKNYEADEISEMVLHLGRFFRLSLDRGQETLSLQETIDHLHHYIRVQQIRFSHQFSVHYEIDKESSNIQMLKLILQPLVENAILHGLEKKMQGGELIIRSQMLDGYLQLQVIDNGAGMSHERLVHITTQLAKPSPVGERHDELFALKNIQSRIHLYYGDQAYLQIDSRAGQGTTVTIGIPVGGGEDESVDR